MNNERERELEVSGSEIRCGTLITKPEIASISALSAIFVVKTRQTGRVDSLMRMRYDQCDIGGAVVSLSGEW